MTRIIKTIAALGAAVWAALLWERRHEEIVDQLNEVFGLIDGLMPAVDLPVWDQARVDRSTGYPPAGNVTPGARLLRKRSAS